MTGLRIEVDLARIGHNADVLVARLRSRRIAVTGVTKALLGLPALATTLVDAGVSSLGDARVENLERLRSADITASTLLLRSPMTSQVERVVRVADTSCNTEPDVLRALSAAAERAGRVHGVLLMVELGDLREGILAADLLDVACLAADLPSLRLVGIGTNLACRSGVIPSERNMDQLSTLANSVEGRIGRSLDVVSGGNSASLSWALSTRHVGKVTHLRLGESILLGLDPVSRTPIDGLVTDSVVVVAEVIESKRKPSLPWGSTGEAAWGVATPAADRGDIWQTIVAIGHQDTDPFGLVPPPSVTVLGASSDHLVLETVGRMSPGDEVRFVPSYGALVRAMTSPFVDVVTVGAAVGGDSAPTTGGRSGNL